MENCWDFVEWLGRDTSSSVLSLLGDAADVVRASAVSKSWRRFVIENGFCKKICLAICPELANFTHVIEVGASVEAEDVGSSSAAEWKNLEKEHRVYTYLSHLLVSPAAKMALPIKAICASSTDNYPDESIDNTLHEGEQMGLRPSYWSSKGKGDPSVPETLTYRLSSKLCVIDEIKIRPFKGESVSTFFVFKFCFVSFYHNMHLFSSAFFQPGFPIYSAKAVQFRICFSRLPMEERSGSAEHDNNWDYVSPEFPMVQENKLQSFKLPRPFVCFGGALQVQLLGRVQLQREDNLYYICVCHVQVVGRLLGPVFDAEINNTTGNLVLKYFPDARGCSTPSEGGPSEEPRESSAPHIYVQRLIQLGIGVGVDQVRLGALLRSMPLEEFEDDIDSDGTLSD